MGASWELNWERIVKETGSVSSSAIGSWERARECA
jgi:hypothetical protein